MTGTEQKRDRLRREAEAGFAELDRGEGTLATVAEHMARIDAAVRARVGK